MGRKQSLPAYGKENMRKNDLTVCGVCCETDCRAYGKDCAGCNLLKGKVSWAKFLGKNLCPIYQCVLNKKIPNCGHCPAIPCKIWLTDTKNPDLTNLEYKADLRRRRINLLNKGEMMSNFNAKIRAEFEKLLINDDYVLAAWEGGSKATGFFDEYSDLDLQIIVKDEEVENIFMKIDQSLEDNYGIIRKFRIPEPNWHGHSQCFYLLKDTPETFYLDLFVEKESAGNRFLESDRHGNAFVWFDKKNLIDTTPTPDEIVQKNCQNYFNRVDIYIPFCFLDVQKQIYRKNRIDAFAIYFSLLNRIIGLMNIKYRPPKHDFGMRYLHRDFPEHEQKLISELMYVPDMKKLQQNLDKLKDVYKQLIKDLKEYNQ